MPATAIGRNVSLFRWAVKEAHRPRVAEVLRVYGRKDCPIWEGIVAAKNADTFGSEALPATEVRSIARSSARYSLRQYDREKFRQIQGDAGVRRQSGTGEASEAQAAHHRASRSGRDATGR